MNTLNGPLGPDPLNRLGEDIKMKSDHTKDLAITHKDT